MRSRAIVGMLLVVVVVAALAAPSGCASGDAPKTTAVNPPDHPQFGHQWVREHFTWEPADDVLQVRAEDQRLKLLNLGTAWCHWCHVMDDTTWRDPAVLDLLAAHFRCARADADARPDLAQRYEDYGWPATIIYDANGTELVRRRGYIPPEQMASLLQAVVADPTPGPSVTGDAPTFASGTGVTLDPAVRKELETRLRLTWDESQGSWGTVHKFMPWSNVEYMLWRALRNDADARHMAEVTLAAQLQLIDPVWGGVYQYSHGGVWTNPHYEKLMQFQAENLRIYSLAFAQFGDERWRKAGAAILGYMRNFLRDPATGAFYVSQDADVVKGEHAADYFQLNDEMRRAIGMPAVDRSVYARENGWAIRGLCAWYAATGDETALADAIRAADYILKERVNSIGVGHGQLPVSGTPLYLGDALWLGIAMSDLADVTGDARWAEEADKLRGRVATFIQLPAGSEPPRSEPPGFVSVTGAGALAPTRQFDDNVAAARWLFRMAALTLPAPVPPAMPVPMPIADDRWQRAMKWLCAPEVATERRTTVGGLLLADDEVRHGMMRITVIGAADAPQTQTLRRAVLALPVPRRAITWLDPGSQAYHESEYADATFGGPVVLLCYGSACSLPISRVEDLRDAAVEMLSRPD